MQQPQHRQSPRPKAKQAQAAATPVSKKPVEYAGPSFNHSPAPAKLPPPPFLSKSLPQRSSGTFGGRASPPVGASPLSFLFDAKQREDSLQHLGDSRPPSLNYRHDDRPESSDQHRPRKGLFNLDGEDQELPLAGKSDTRPTSVESAVPTSTAPRKSPWATVEKPKSIDLFNSSVHEAQAPGPNALLSKDAISDSPVKRGSGGGRNASVEKSSQPKTNNTKAKKGNGENSRKRKSPKNSPATEHTTPRASQVVAPKVTLLKRDVGESPAPNRGAQTENRAARAATPSTFRPLKKAQAQSPAPPVETHNEKSEEEDLRQQAANLMAILQLNPASSSSRDSCPVGLYNNKNNNNIQGSNESSPSTFESDIRRMLQLGA